MEELKERTPRPEGKGWVWDEENNKWFRVRKLTPREAFRLMGVREHNIDKIQSARFGKDVVPVPEGKPISESQQYKMAGNSIVVDVLYYVYKNLFAPQTIIPQEGDQLTLF